MNKTNNFLLEHPLIRMDFFGNVKLKEYWNPQNVLSGFFWRFYHNSTAGAGVYVGSHRIELRPDRIYILPPNCNLKVWCEAEPVQLYLHFELSQFTGNPEFICNELPLTAEMSQQIDRMRDLLNSPSPQNLPQVKLLGLALAANAMTHLPEAALCTVTPDLRIEQVCDYMRGNLDKELSIKLLAEKIHMAPNSFARLFEQITGTTPYRYLLQLRYGFAAHLLETGRFSIDEICEMIGVKDRFHFTRRFKKIYSLTPGQYRALLPPPASTRIDQLSEFKKTLKVY